MGLEFDVAAWFARVRAHVDTLAKNGADAVRARESASPLETALAELLIHNAALWGYEDEVRRDDIGFEEVARYKRQIDRENQLRNDAIDRADALLRAEAERARGTPDPALPLNTETPGSAFDRLTILALRLRSLRLETERDGAEIAHRERCRERLREVEERAADLVRSLAELLADVRAGRKRLKNYRTHKLYNDPETNPAVRAARGG